VVRIPQIRLRGIFNPIGCCVVCWRHNSTHCRTTNGNRRWIVADILKFGSKFSIFTIGYIMPEGTFMNTIQNPVLFAYTLGFLFTCIFILYIYLDTRVEKK